jgi:type I restriction enzyme R subunit
MVGRGTRTCSSIEKEKFTIFDCVGVVEYFQGENNPPFDKYRVEGETGDGTSKGPKNESGGEMIIADDVTDTLISSESGYRFLTTDGEELRPDDYISAFERYIQDNSDRIDAIRLLENRPEQLRRSHLEELNEKLRSRSETFTEQKLQKAYSREMVDLIGFVKHAIGAEGFPTIEQRVEKAFETWQREYDFTSDELLWLNMMREHFKQEREIKQEDFSAIPFIRKGGWGSAVNAFGGEERLRETLKELNNEVLS